MNKLSNESNGKTNGSENGLQANVQVLPLPSGMFLFTVEASAAQVASTEGRLSLPALHVGLGPGMRSDQVEFVAGPSTHGAWLFNAGDLLITKVNSPGATLILTSVRTPGGDVLSVKVERLENRVNGEIAGAPPVTAQKPMVTPGAKPSAGARKPATKRPDDQPLPVHVVAHIRTRGDMNFANMPWAGRIAPGLWIESFSLKVTEQLAASDIEYKGLTGSGFETPWLSDNKMCGTKGMATPLMGFAIRLKPGSAAANFVCEYSGYFKSGKTIGPLYNGAPCRSSVADDSLEGIQVRLVKRTAATAIEAAPTRSIKKSAAKLKPAGRNDNRAVVAYSRASRGRV